MNDRVLIKRVSQAYCKDKEDLCLAIGIISNGSIKKIFLGNNGCKLEENSKTYEIGSITKTFLASIYSDLMEECKVSLEDKIMHTTVLEVLTHTSNVGEIPFIPTASNRNGYTGYTREDVFNSIKKKSIPNQNDWKYSNLGFALAGIYLEDMFQQPISQIMQTYIRRQLKLSRTSIGYNKCAMVGHNYKGNPANWTWESDDIMIPAGGVIATIDDMICYLSMQMESAEQTCKDIHIKTNMPFDMGLAWMIDKESSSRFCMGLTDGFSSFIGFNKQCNKGIVILSNYWSQGYGIKGTPNQIGLDYLRSAKSHYVADQQTNL